MRMALATSLSLWLLAAAVAPAAGDGATPPAAAPRLFGQEPETIRISATTLIRWQRGRTTLLDLRGSASLYQGTSSVRAGRLLVWFQEAERGGKKTGVIEAYGEKGMTLREDDKESLTDSPAIVRMVTSGGVVLSGRQTLAGDAPVTDPFRARAFVLHGDAPEGAAEAAAGGPFSEFSPSAERVTMSDVTDAGATVTLAGNAEIVSNDMTLLADVLRVRIVFSGGRYKSSRAQSVYAEGSVELRRGDLVVTSDALYMDWITNQGLAIGARIRARDPVRNIPAQISAGAIREQSLYRFTTEGTGYFTTSELAEPFYRVESARMQAVRGPEPPAAPQPESPAPAEQPPESLVVSATGLTLRAGPLPLFYWPYVARDLRGGTFLLKGAEIGSDYALGSFLKLQWSVNDLLGVSRNDLGDLTLRTDAYPERGLGLGLDDNYKNDERHGYLRAYYINDYGTTDEDYFPAPRSDNRGELTFRDRENLGDGWQSDEDLGYLSDRHYLLTYDERSLDEDQDRETQVFLSHIAQNSLFTIQARTRINDFQNQLERESVGYHAVGSNIFNTPLLWTTDTDLSRLQLRYDKSLGIEDPHPVGRLDSANEVSYPVQLGFIRADPFLWGDLTGYTIGANDDPSSLRAATAYGVRTAANFYRTFDIHSDFLGIDRLRHILTPTVEYLDRWYVSRDPSHYIQNDEIDALDQANVVTPGLRSRLQTYRETDSGRKLVEFFLTDVKYHWFFQNQDTYPNIGDYFEATTCWAVNNDVELMSVDDRWNSQYGRVDAANGELELNYWRPFRLSFIYKYYVDPTDTAGTRHSIAMFQVAYQRDHSRWRVEFNTAYDFLAEREPGETRSPNALGTAVFLTRNMEGWDFSIGVEFNEGLANEMTFMFRIAPPGSQPQFRTSRNPFWNTSEPIGAQP